MKRYTTRSDLDDRGSNIRRRRLLRVTEKISVTLQLTAGSFMNHDAPSGKSCDRIVIDAGAHLIVINNHVAVVLVPDLYPEFVHATSAVYLTIGGCQDEPIIAHAINRAG